MSVKQLFERDGYVVIPGLLSRKEAASLPGRDPEALRHRRRRLREEALRVRRRRLEEPPVLAPDRPPEAHPGHPGVARDRRRATRSTPTCMPIEPTSAGIATRPAAPSAWGRTGMNLTSPIRSCGWPSTSRPTPRAIPRSGSSPAATAYEEKITGPEATFWRQWITWRERSRSKWGKLTRARDCPTTCGPETFPTTRSAPALASGCSPGRPRQSRSGSGPSRATASSSTSGSTTPRRRWPGRSTPSSSRTRPRTLTAATTGLLPALPQRPGLRPARPGTGRSLEEEGLFIEAAELPRCGYLMRSVEVHPRLQRPRSTRSESTNTMKTVSRIRWPSYPPGADRKASPARTSGSLLGRPLLAALDRARATGKVCDRAWWCRPTTRRSPPSPASTGPRSSTDRPRSAATRRVPSRRCIHVAGLPPRCRVLRARAGRLPPGHIALTPAQ